MLDIRKIKKHMMKNCQCLYESDNGLPRTRMCFAPCPARFEILEERERMRKMNLNDLKNEVGWLCWKRGCEITPNPERKEGEHPTLIIRDLGNGGIESKLVYIDGDGDGNGESKGTVETMKGIIDMLSDEERKELFLNYCTHCGSRNTSCVCMRDE